MKKLKQEQALAAWKAKRDAWAEEYRLRMERERLDLARERFEEDVGRAPRTEKAARDLLIHDN